MTMVDVDEAHELYRRLPDETLECLSCGESWPCDELRRLREMARASVDDHEPGGRGADGHLRCAACGYRWPCMDVVRAGRALTPTEEALIELVEPGWSIWEREKSFDITPPGGLVLDFTDDDDGRTYTVLDWKGRQPVFRRIKAIDCAPTLAQMPRLNVIRDTWRRLCRLVGEERGSSDTEEIRMIETALTLTRLGTKGHAA